MNNKGGIKTIIAIVAGITIFIIAAWIYITLASIWVQGFSIMTSALHNLPSTPQANISYYSDVTFGNLNAAFGQLRWWTVMIIMGMFLGILISMYLVKVHPAWFAFYVIIAFVLIMFSIFVSRSYEDLYNSQTQVGIGLQSFGGASAIMLYLPIWVTVIAFVGGIFVFTSMGRGEEGSLI